MSLIGLNADWIDGDDQKLRRCLELANQPGANCCELIMHSMDVILNGKLVKHRVRDVQKVLDAFKFNYSIHMPYSFDPQKGNIHENIAFFKQCIDFAKIINADVMTVHASDIDICDAATLNRNIEIYKEISDYAGRTGRIKIGVEPPYYSHGIKACENKLGTQPIALAEHIKDIGCENIGITLDFGHAFLNSENFKRNYVDDVKIMSKYAVHTHVHDNFGKHGEMKNYMDNYAAGIGDLHLVPSWGAIDWNEVLPLFKNYEGKFILETEFRHYPYFSEGIRFLTGYFANCCN